MTYDEAIEFFYKYGNVGKSVEDLKSVRPTYGQLMDARDVAISRGQCSTLALCALTTVLGEGLNENSTTEEILSRLS
jgi:hypothetical protein